MFIFVVTDGKVLFFGQRLFFIEHLVLVRDVASLFIPENQCILQTAVDRAAGRLLS